jgi:hypothetical protein
MPARFIKSAAWLLAVGYTFFRCWAGPAQNSPPAGPPTILKEFQENGLAYFPAGTFKKPDDHYGESFALYLRSIGEPPLLRSADNSQAHASHDNRLSSRKDLGIAITNRGRRKCEAICQRNIF